MGYIYVFTVNYFLDIEGLIYLIDIDRSYLQEILKKKSSFFKFISLILLVVLLLTSFFVYDNVSNSNVIYDFEILQYFFIRKMMPKKLGI